MKLDEEIIIKDKIDIIGIIICVVFFVISIASFIGYFDSNEVKNVKLLFVGTLLGIIFILLIPYLTFKRPYLKINSMGIIIRRPQGFTYGKEIFIAWNSIDAILMIDKVLTINKNKKEIQEKELNAESISNLDKFKGLTQEDYEDEAEWLENGIYISSKELKDVNPEIYPISTIIDNNDIEIIKKIWINNI